MNKVIRIMIISLCAALSLSSCRKNRHTPDVQEQQVPIGFSAVSQTSTVKSGTKATTSLSEFHDNFGVWGIARKADHHDYILWGTSSMSPVNKVSATEYKPEEDAYWLSGYTYNFLAVAPYEETQDYRISFDTSSGSESAMFSYDLSSKYSRGNYSFDLMAAVAETSVAVSSTQPSQSLTFWHLLTTIKINVIFEDSTGKINGLRLSNVDADADYTISFDEKVANEDDKDADYPLDVDYDASESENLKTIYFVNLLTGGNIIRIVPQDISEFQLFLDFNVTKDGKTSSTTNFEVNLEAAKANPLYGPNQWYNWTVRISPKYITFDVSVTPWVDGDDFEQEIE